MFKSKYQKTQFSIKHQIVLVKMLIPYLYRTRQVWLENAKKMIEELKLDEADKKVLLKNYFRDYEKYRQTFTEYYYCYQFPKLSEKQKADFLTMRDVQFIVRKYHILYPEQCDITGYKDRFLKEYAEFVHRKWMIVDSNSSFEEVQEFIDRFDVIAKPTNSESGKGVYKIYQGKGDAQKILSGKLPILLEECVKSVDELAEFHPSSLNTIRVVTIANGKDVRLFGAVLRTGNNNSVFDNADAGGFFAEVDTETGEILSNGVTEMGVEVEAHSASGKVFKGSCCPKWSEVVEVCKKAALHNPKTTIIAWDIAVTPKGVEIIEGNSFPSIYIHQVPLHKGVRKKFYSQMDELGLPYRDVMFWVEILSRVVNACLQIKTVRNRIKKRI